MFFKHLWFLLTKGMGSADTTVTTVLESIPTIIGAALLELGEGDIVSQLITRIDFPGPGYIHQTPFVVKVSALETDAPTTEAIEMTGSDETSPSAATVAVHSAYILLKDLANLASIEDMAALAGQLIGNALVVRRDLDLCNLFTGLTTNQGGLTATAAMSPADLYDAYGSLRLYSAPLPYHIILNPQQIWNVDGLISLFDNSSDSINGGSGVGTVGEDWTRYGFSGMVMGFNLWADANITFTTTVNCSGAAISRQAFKQVFKRGLDIEVQRDISVLGTRVVGSEIRGEVLLRNKHGNEMQFPLRKTA